MPSTNEILRRIDISKHRLGLSKNQPTSPHNYSELEDASHQIRLIYIEPDSDAKANLRLSVKPVWLSKNPKYDALSYRWGSDEAGTASSQNVQSVQLQWPSATRSLVEALMCLRSKGIRVIWADALCINQADSEERVAQVKIMGQIYTRAKRVHVWLDNLPARFTQPLSDSLPPGGASDEDGAVKLSNKLFAEMESLMKERRRYAEMSPILPPDRVSRLTRRRERYEPTGAREALHVIDLVHEEKCSWQLPFFKATRGHDGSLILRKEYFMGLACLHWLITRPYWSRVWIVQELLLANVDPIVHAGVDFETSISKLSSLTGRMRRTKLQGNPHVGCCAVFNNCAFGDVSSLETDIFAVTHLTHIVSEASYQTPISWKEAFHLSSPRSATDPRDHVYAFLGLTYSTSTSADFLVNYSWSVDLVWKLGTLIAYNHKKSLELFETVGTAKGTHQYGLPSWVLRWDKDSLSETSLLHWTDCRASGNFSYEPDGDYSDDHHDASLEVFKVRAIRVGIITRSKDGAEEKTPQAELEAMQRWQREFGDLNAVGDFSDDRNFAFGCVMMYDGQHFIPDDENRQRVAAKLREIRDRERPSDAFWPEFTHGMCFFSMSDGSLGKARVGARPGDEIFIVRGCPWPVVLRPAPKGGDGKEARKYCELVSICYLEGHMDGGSLNDSTQWERTFLV